MRLSSEIFFVSNLLMRLYAFCCIIFLRDFPNEISCFLAGLRCPDKICHVLLHTLQMITCSFWPLRDVPVRFYAFCCPILVRHILMIFLDEMACFLVAEFCFWWCDVRAVDSCFSVLMRFSYELSYFLTPIRFRLPCDISCFLDWKVSWQDILIRFKDFCRRKISLWDVMLVSSILILWDLILLGRYGIFISDFMFLEPYEISWYCLMRFRDFEIMRCSREIFCCCLRC